MVISQVFAFVWAEDDDIFWWKAVAETIISKDITYKC